MIPTEVRPIVLALLEKAKAKKVKWVVAADIGMGGKEDDFVVNFPDYSVNIYRAQNERGITFTIINKVGKVIYGTTVSPPDPDYSLMSDIIRLAGMQVLRLDEALESIRRALQQEGTVGGGPAPEEDADLPF